MIDVQTATPKYDQRTLMAELLKEDAEAWASLSGLMAILALPPLRSGGDKERRRRVWVEIARDQWQQVHSIAIEPDRILFWYGFNGSRQEYVFLRSAGVPRWRLDDIELGSHERFAR